MYLNLPSSGLGRGRVWRSQAWVGGAQSKKPWLGTLNSETRETAGDRRRSSGGSCPWAEGHDLPYIQQLNMSDKDAFRDSLIDFRLPSPTTPSPQTSRDWSQHPQSHVTSSPAAPDDVTAEVKPCSDSFEIIHNPYVMRAYIQSLWTVGILRQPPFACVWDASTSGRMRGFRWQFHIVHVFYAEQILRDVWKCHTREFMYIHFECSEIWTAYTFPIRAWAYPSLYVLYILKCFKQLMWFSRSLKVIYTGAIRWLDRLHMICC